MENESGSDPGVRLISRRRFIGGVMATAMTAAYGRQAQTARAASAAVTISRGSTSNAVVALTFDCGADSGYTGSILDTLANRGVKASFGVTGKFAASYPSLVKRMVNEGHSLINHSYSHPSFSGLTTTQRLSELESTEQALVNASGRAGRPLFRPPYGEFNSSVLTDLGNAGFTYNIMWSIDVLGWNGLTRDQVINRALSNHGNGYIYLMHVGGQSQEGPALPSIIDGLRSRGYGFVTIPQMLGGTSAPPPPSPPATGFNIGDTVKVTAGLYLRTAPTLSSGVITTMPTGTVCTIVGGPTSADGYTWYQVKTTYGTGWAAGQYLQLTTSTPPPATPGGYAAGTKVRVTSGLWLRTAPNLSGGVITTMPTGTICTVLSGPSPSGGYTWYQLDTPYGQGWAAGEYLEVTTQSPPPPTTTPVGYAAGTKLSVTSALYLRASASLSSGVITTMPVGTIVTVVSGPSPSGGYTWYQVDTPYGRGWAAGEFLKPATTAPPSTTEPPPPTTGGHAAGTTLRVISGLWLRTAGNLSGGVITTMPTGTIVTVVSGPSPSGGYTWYQLDTPYGRGWAAGEFLEPTTQSPPPVTNGYPAGTKLRVTAGLWLRTAGNLSGSVITTMPTDTIVTVVSGPSPSGGYTWYQLDTPYGRGWAAGEFLVRA